MKNLKKTGTTKNQPWSVKGVSMETRQAVKIAARKSGLTIGDWLEQNLRLMATDSLKNNLPAQRLEDQLAEISSKLDELQQPIWKRIFRAKSTPQ